MRAPRRRTWIMAAIVSMAAAPATAEEKPAPHEALLRLARQRFVRVEYQLKPSEEPVEDEEGIAGFYRQMQGVNYQYYLDEKMPLEIVGVLLDAKGTVMIGDFALDEKHLDRIEVVLPDGQRVAAKRHKLLHRAPAELLRLDEPARLPGEPFVVPPEITADTCLYAVALGRHEDRWLASWAPLRPAFDYAAKAADPLYLLAGRGGWDTAVSVLTAMSDGPFGFVKTTGELFLAARSPLILTNEKGDPVGCVIGAGVDAHQVDEDWQGQSLLDGAGITAAELSDLKKRCEQQWGPRVFRCLLQFRTKARGRPSDPFSAMFEMQRAFGGADAGSQKEWSVVGLAVGPRRLFVPRSITRQRAARIEGIQVTAGDQKRPARFVGAFKQFGGFLLELTEGQLPDFELWSEQPVPKRNALLLAVEAEPKLGGVKLTVKHNRWISRQRGYEARHYEQLMQPVKPGTLLLTPNLQLTGVMMRQRKEGEELKAYEKTSSPSSAFMAMASGAESTLFWSSAVRGVLSEPTAHFDKQIRQMTKEEQERRAWLGVEFARLSADLAKQLKVEKPTRDGQIGLLVNYVYDASPAKKLGLKVGDILLKMKVPHRPGPIKLSAGETGYMGFDWSGFEMPEEYQAMGVEFPTAPPWKPRGNYLTKMLDAVGQGEKVDSSRICPTARRPPRLSSSSRRLRISTAPRSTRTSRSA